MKSITVRLPEALLAEIDALVPLLGEHSSLRLVTAIDRATVMRAALVKGCAALRAECAPPTATVPAVSPGRLPPPLFPPEGSLMEATEQNVRFLRDQMALRTPGLPPE
ncbi:MAG: hypothetical protein HQL57_06815 [Magnetococcales bacterium]|nr:hypothetical protein [Magnetococcales bacterium]MBF0156881.1 hypothetical protein [Magnetococcales bacterium]